MSEERKRYFCDKCGHGLFDNIRGVAYCRNCEAPFTHCHHVIYFDEDGEKEEEVSSNLRREESNDILPTSKPSYPIRNITYQDGETTTNDL